MDVLPSTKHQMQSVSRLATAASPGSSSAPTLQNRTRRKGVDTSASKNATISWQLSRPPLLPDARNAPPPRTKPAPRLPPARAPQATSTDAPDFPQTAKSANWKRPYSSARSTHTPRKPPMSPQPDSALPQK